MAEPLFINSKHGKLFAMHYPRSTQLKGRILHIPAFAEEMNKSRRMVALQAAAFNRQGYAVLVLDLFGTGDSQGLLEHADWQIWQDNIDAALDWLSAQYPQQHALYLWGLRFGCALAIDYLARQTRHIHGLILWQPLLSGKLLLNQFLRLRVAGFITAPSDQPRETVKGLFSELANGTAIEVGGYMISPTLSTSLLAIDSSKLKLPAALQLLWIELVADQQLPPVSQKPLDNWDAQGVQCSSHAINGDRFWSTQEIATCDTLIDTSSQALQALQAIQP